MFTRRLPSYQVNPDLPPLIHEHQNPPEQQTQIWIVPWSRSAGDSGRLSPATFSTDEKCCVFNTICSPHTHTHRLDGITSHTMKSHPYSFQPHLVVYSRRRLQSETVNLFIRTEESLHYLVIESDRRRHFTQGQAVLFQYTTMDSLCSSCQIEERSPWCPRCPR